MVEISLVNLKQHGRVQGFAWLCVLCKTHCVPPSFREESSFTLPQWRGGGSSTGGMQVKSSSFSPQMEVNGMTPCVVTLFENGWAKSCNTSATRSGKSGRGLKL